MTIHKLLAEYDAARMAENRATNARRDAETKLAMAIHRRGHNHVVVANRVIEIAHDNRTIAMTSVVVIAEDD